MSSLRVPVTSSSHAAEARRLAAGLARQIGLGETDAGRVALVVTELATNIALHANDGEILVRDQGGSPPAIEVLAIDRGPGIGDVARAFEEGHSTAGTLGQGLGIVRRQADEFEVFSAQPGGTVAVARIRSGKADAVEEFSIGGISVAHAGEPVCGDDWAVTWRRNQGEVLVVDGLGHGVAASEAAAQAVRAFRASHASAPAAVVDELHLALRPTRGAALAVAAIDRDVQIVKYAGLGNIGASIVTPDRRRTSLVSQNGTAGHAARRITEFSYPFRDGSALVMFSDGLASGWDPAAYPRLWSYDPAIVAGVLYRDFSRRRDDVTVVVGKSRQAT